MHYGGCSEATGPQAIPRQQLGKAVSLEPGPSFLMQDLFNGLFWPGTPHRAGQDFLRTSLSFQALLTPFLRAVPFRRHRRFPHTELPCRISFWHLRLGGPKLMTAASGELQENQP